MNIADKRYLCEFFIVFRKCKFFCVSVFSPILLLFCFFFLLACNNFNETSGLFGGRTQNEIEKEFIDDPGESSDPIEPEEGAQEEYVFELKDYKPGEYIYPNRRKKDLFIKRIISFLEKPDPGGKFPIIKEIVITGFADGIEYRGGLEWSEVKVTECREQSSGNLTEDSLARVRACLIKESIKLHYEKLPLVTNYWKIEFKNFDDAEHIGGEYRKVVVTVYIVRGLKKKNI